MKNSFDIGLEFDIVFENDTRRSTDRSFNDVDGLIINNHTVPFGAIKFYVIGYKKSTEYVNVNGDNKFHETLMRKHGHAWSYQNRIIDDMCINKENKDETFEYVVAKAIEETYHKQKDIQAQKYMLCFLERYVLPFEEVLAFQQTGKIKNLDEYKTFGYLSGKQRTRKDEK